MASKRSSSKRKAFEFLLTLEQKQRCQQLACAAGISLSAFIRISIDDYYAMHELKIIAAEIGGCSSKSNIVLMPANTNDR